MKSLTLAAFALLLASQTAISEEAPKPTPATPEKHADAVAPVKWFYRKQWPEIWSRANGYLNAPPEKALKVLNISGAGFDQNPVARDELAMARGLALAKAKLTLSAQYIYMDIMQKSAGSGPSQFALSELSNLTQTEFIDEQLIKDVAPSFDFTVESAEAADMINFFKWKSLGERRMKDWGEKFRQKIGETSAWQAEIRYEEAVALVAENELDKASAAFEAVAQDPRARSQTKQRAALQVSRLLFENSDFDTAFKRYQLLDLPLRERGRALLEMAWSRFYQKNFSEALGILHALRNPVFDSARSPERYILEMLILRDLCHYEGVAALEKQFLDEYKPIFDEIESRQRYQDNSRISSLVMLDGRFQDRANLIHQIRREREKIKGLSIDDKMQKELLGRLQRREDSLMITLQHEIQKRAKPIADALIDQREQIKFIGYSSNIQSKGDDRMRPGYENEKSAAFSYETLYWPVKYNEFWWDEVSYYRAQIKSRCGDAAGKAAK